MFLQAARDAIANRKKTKKGKLPPPNFKVGDKVWRQNVRIQQRKGGKLDPDYLGPFTIVALQNKSTDLSNEEGRIFKRSSLIT